MRGVRAHEPKPIEECERFPEKRRFDLASDAIATIRNAFARDGLRLYYYRCDSCGGYHLSKRPGPE
jgi:hypothetical protein